MINLTFTDSAASKVKSLVDEEGNPALNLRLYISGGGCSGFQYGFSFDDSINADDVKVEKTVVEENPFAAQPGQIKLLVDSMSYQYLKGATVDYREDINGAQFVIKNPNAKTTCGCGSSFSVDE